MKIANRKPFAQGELTFIPVDAVPADAREVQPSDGLFIAGHSETGHHHAIKAAGVRFFETADPLTAFLRMETVDHADVEHMRPWDTHETVRLLEGAWKIRRAREHTPEGWTRAVMD